jgi:hypothetical protein
LRIGDEDWADVEITHDIFGRCGKFQNNH